MGSHRFIIVQNSDLNVWKGVPGMRFKRQGTLTSYQLTRVAFPFRIDKRREVSSSGCHRPRMTDPCSWVFA
jgi:hypothetical protein